MSRIYVKNLPKLRLADLIKRRKTTLKTFLSEFGITTYEGLLERCARMGVGSPTRDEFMATETPVVSSPSEGVIVLEPPRTLQELEGLSLAEDETPQSIPGLLSDTLEAPTKRQRKKVS